MMDSTNFDAQDFTHIKTGDEVTRMLAGTIPMKMKVIHVDDNFIYCGASGLVGTPLESLMVEDLDAYWKFDRATGAEVDEDLGWGPAFTGSILRRE